MFLSSVLITVHLENLRHNLRLLRMRHPHLMPVIKADAYGHGVIAVAHVLAEEEISWMAVGTVGEGVLLRQEGHTARLLSLLGLSRQEDPVLAATYQIMPLIHSKESLERYITQGYPAGDGNPLPLAIAFDTGMSRLGFYPEDAADLASYLSTLPQVRPVLVVSHLAASDEPQLDEFTKKQITRFQIGAAAFRAVFPNIKTSLANSPGLLTWPDCTGDLARPGMALYGGNPLHGTERAELGAGLMPVMEVTAPLLSVREIPAGTSIGYGCTFKTEKKTRVAVIGAGYADGYPRSLSNRASVLIRGERAQVLGRICMQMCMVDVTTIPEVVPGDMAHLLGGEGVKAIRPEELAQWWGTSPYEIFCSLGRNRRVSEKNFHSF